MTKPSGLVIITDYTHNAPLTLEEVCRHCHVNAEFIYHLVEYDILKLPQPAQSLESLQFDLAQLQRIKTVIRLQHDLEVNLAGIAVVLNLLDELNDLREKIKIIERHY